MSQMGRRRAVNSTVLVETLVTIWAEADHTRRPRVAYQTVHGGLRFPFGILDPRFRS